MGKAEDDAVAKAFAEMGIVDTTGFKLPPREPDLDLGPKAAPGRRSALTYQDPTDGPVLINGADVKPQAVSWLWPGWLAKRKLHILAGAPGQGKTTIALALSAVVSAGGRWPDGTQCKPGNVLIWSGEDDFADTLLPRLLTMGANPKRIYFVAGTRDNGEVKPFDPARDLVPLTDAASRLGTVSLMMLDPVVSAVSGDSHKNGEVRRALQPLVDLGSALGAAMLGITHFSKGTSGREPTERVTGSVAFGAVARVVMVAAKIRKGDEDHRVFARAKSNIGPDEGGFEYSVVQAEVADHPGLQAARIQWGDMLAGTARDLLAEAEQEEGDDEPSDAAAFLRDLLADGPVPVPEVKRHADEAGHTWRTVQRAMKRAGVQSKRAGFGKPATWAIPSSGATVAPVAPLPESGANGATGATEADAEVF